MKRLTQLRKLMYLFINIPFFAHSQSKCLEMHVLQTEPLGYINSQNKLVGLQVDYLEALEKQTGLCINKQLMPYSLMWASIEQKSHDGGFMFKDAQKSHLVTLIGHAQNIQTLVIPSKDDSIEDYPYLYELVIGKAAGSAIFSKYKSDEKLNIIEIENYEDLTKLLEMDRLDAIAGSEPILRYQLAKHKLTDQVNLSGVYVLDSREQWLQMPLKEYPKEDIEKLTRAVQVLRHNNTFEQLMNSYFGQ